MKSKRLLHTSAAVFAATGLLLSGCSSGGPDGADRDSAGGSASAGAFAPSATPAAGLNRYYQQKLSWRECGAPGFECASMTVPLDYAAPGSGDDLKIAVSRKKAQKGGGPRIGSLLVNPGGPGGSAIDYLQSAAAVGYPAPVRARYDIVAFDPRGVARSEPVTCLTDRGMDRFTRTDSTPDDQAEINSLVTAGKRFANGCERRSGAVIPHVSTVEAARDMDVLRALLGDERLNYVGLSYGTFLGATYADLFPKRVGRLVLDGAMDPTVPALAAGRGQAGGFERAFRAFAADCVRLSGCPLGRGTVAEAGADLDRFFARLDSAPVPTEDPDRDLDEPLAVTGVMAAMYEDSYWAVLREALQSAKEGDGTGLLRLSDLYYERDDDGKYGNLMYANAAVNCLDLPPAARTPADVEKALPSFHKASPRFGAMMAWAGLSCASWPVKPTGEAHRVEAEGAAPILVVGTTRDPATPYEWAKGLASQLDSGVLLTFEGDGHTAYTRGSDCVDTAVNTYLLEGETPPNGKRCT